MEKREAIREKIKQANREAAEKMLSAQPAYWPMLPGREMSFKGVQSKGG
jgi:hypothetical protein